MKQGFKKALVMLLSVAMVFTFMAMPVYADDFTEAEANEVLLDAAEAEAAPAAEEAEEIAEPEAEVQEELPAEEEPAPDIVQEEALDAVVETVDPVRGETSALEQVLASIGELSIDPRDFTANDVERVEAIQTAYDALSGDDQATVDKTTGHPSGDGQSYGRILESAVWAVRSFNTDTSTTLANATYTTATNPAISSGSDKGKSDSSRVRNWWVESVVVENGQATAYIYVTSGDATASKLTSYPSVWVGGQTINRDENNNYPIPVDLNGTTYFGGVSSSMPRPIMYTLSTTIDESVTPQPEEPEVVELKITNKTGMFKAVSASAVENADGSAVLTFALSSDGYKWIYKGTYEDALAANDAIAAGIQAGEASGNLIKGYLNGEGKWEFQMTIAANELGKPVPVVSISESKYNNFVAGTAPLEKAYYPRQFELNLDAETLITGDYDMNYEFALVTELADFKAATPVSVHIVGGPNSNNYKVEPTLVMNDTTYDNVAFPSAEEPMEAELTDGKFEISMLNQPNNAAFKDKTPLTFVFHVAKDAPYAEADNDVVRTVTFDQVAKTITVEGTALTPKEPSAEPIELQITNKTGMFKAVSASAVENADGSAVLTFALSSDGYKWIYKGTYEDALAANDAIAAGIQAGEASGNLIKGYLNGEGKWEFQMTIAANELGKPVPVVSISESKYNNFVAGTAPLEKAYYPRQFELNLDAETLITGDYDMNYEFALVTELADFKAATPVSVHIVGGPNSNNYKVEPTLVMNDTTYDNVAFPSAEEPMEAELTDGKFEISMVNQPNNAAFKDKTPLTFTFHVAETAPYKEAGTDVVRTVTFDQVAKTITVEGIALTPGETPQPIPVSEFAYDGNDVKTIKEDGSGFGMFTPQEGTAISLSGDNVVIHYVPKNTTVYAGFYLKADISITDTWSETSYFALEEGAFDITLPKSYCGKAWPIAPVKVTDPSATTSAQYYLAIPSEDKLTPPAPEIAEGTYKLPDLAASAGMFNHFVTDSATLVVSDGKATIQFTTDGSTASIQKYSKIALGKSSELLEDNYQATVPEGTIVVEGVENVVDGKSLYTFTIELAKADVEKMVANESPDDLYITLWNKVGSSDQQIPGWYKASNDIYLTLGTLVPGGHDTSYTAGQYIVGIKTIKLPAGTDYSMFVPRYNGVDNTALVTVAEDGSATIYFDNNRNTYKAIYLGELETGSNPGNLGQLPTDEQLASDAYIATKTTGTAAPFEFEFAFNTADLGKTVPYVTVSRSNGKFNSSQLAFVFDESMTLKAVYDVIDMIDALPAAEDVTVRDKDAIEAARAAYEALTDDQKAQVTNLDKLVAAEEAYAALPEKDETTIAVETAIGALIQQYYDVNATTAAAVAETRAAYDALSAQQQAYIDEATYHKLVRAEACVAFVNEDGIKEGMILDTAIDTSDDSPFIAATLDMRTSAAYIYLYSVADQYTDASKVSGTVSKSTHKVVGDGSILKGLWQVQSGEGHGREFVIKLTGSNGDSGDITVKVPSVYGAMEEGTYEVTAIQTPSSNMRKFQRSTVTSDGTTMTVEFVMPNTTYGKIFLGTKDAAAAATEGFIEPTGTEPTSSSAGMGNVYSIPLESMYSPMVISYCNTSKNTWTQETVEFVVDEQAQAVIDAIAALDLNTYFNVTADQREQVNAANELYQALNDNQKAIVGNSNYSTLKRVVAMFRIADIVAAEIEELPAKDSVTEADVSAIRKVKADFDGMGQSDIIKEVLGQKPDGTWNTLQNSQIEKLITKELKDKLSACVEAINPADYTAVDGALAIVPSELSIYTEETAAAVTEAVNAVDRTKMAFEQVEVDAMAHAIETAVAGLVKKPADYSAVDAALAKVPSDLSIYTEESATAVTTAVNAVDRTKKIDEQEAVNAMAQAIEDAIAGLVKKPADYSAVDAALAKVPSDLSIYTEEAAAAVTAAVNAVDRTKKFDEQTEVDAMAQAIETALAGLKGHKDINSEKVFVNPAQIEVDYDGTPQTVEAEVDVAGVGRLEEGKDYTVSYKNNINIGNAEIVVTGIGDYCGTRSTYFSILGNLERNVTEVSHYIADKDYTGSDIVVDDLKIIAMGQEGTRVELTEGKDYVIKSRNGAGIGDNSIVIEGKGYYVGEYEARFKIKGNFEKEATQLKITGLEYRSYTGSEIELKPYVSAIGVDTGKKVVSLVEGEDYILSYKNNKDIGTAEITVTGIGYYTGSRTVTHRIVGNLGYKATKVSVTGMFYQPYTGSEIKIKPTVKAIGPEGTVVTLKEDKDYTLSYENNVNIGTVTVIITGKGQYVGRTTRTHRIVGKLDNSATKLSVTGLEYRSYSGSEIKLEPTVKAIGPDGTVVTLKKDTDYTLSYKNNKNIGNAEITITGKGWYVGSKTVTHRIVGNLGYNATKVEVTGLSSRTYTGSDIRPEPTVKAIGPDGSVVTLKKGTDYTLSYADNRSVRTAKITITGKGWYVGSKTVTFRIIPKGTTISSIGANSKGFTVKWNKQDTKMAYSCVTGYEIQYSTSSTFASGNTTVKVSGYTNVSRTVSGLTANKKYYVRVRTYKTVDGTTYYSNWSSSKSVTTK